jgi:hypothetical protein
LILLREVVDREETSIRNNDRESFISRRDDVTLELTCDSQEDDSAKGDREKQRS